MGDSKCSVDCSTFRRQTPESSLHSNNEWNSTIQTWVWYISIEKIWCLMCSRHQILPLAGFIIYWHKEQLCTQASEMSKNSSSKTRSNQQTISQTASHMQFYSARQLKSYCRSRKTTVQKWMMCFWKCLEQRKQWKTILRFSQLSVIVHLIELVVLYE